MKRGKVGIDDVKEITTRTNPGEEISIPPALLRHAKLLEVLSWQEVVDLAVTINVDRSRMGEIIREAEDRKLGITRNAPKTSRALIVRQNRERAALASRIRMRHENWASMAPAGSKRRQKRRR